MPKTMFTKIASLLAAAAVSGCVMASSEPSPLPPLAQDQSQPALALLEHVLTGYFAGAGANGPTACAALAPTALTDAQETALIGRFVRLAPGARCKAQGAGVVDSVTGDPAVLVQVYDFSCANAGLCSGWVSAPGAPATRYALRFEGGEWRFDGDPRIIAQ
ncbi:MAG: hypothetical protein ABIT16_00800 [Croceibacterium sp.]